MSLSRPRAWLAVLAAVALLAGLGGYLAVGAASAHAPGRAHPAAQRGSAGRRSRAGRATPAAPAGATPAAPPTFDGPDGVEASWVVAENRRPGTTGWRIVGRPPGTIAGFANSVSAVPGQQVSLYVSTNAASFAVTAYRMGYYGGDGAREVWTSGRLVGRLQPPCPVTPGVNMVACDNWTPSLRLKVTAAFVQGDYLLKLTGSAGQASYIPLTVIDPASRATYLIKNDVYTWQAWNPYGGYDYYAGIGSCAPGIYPLCTRARIVSFDRPYGYAQGAGDFLGIEYPLVRWAEQHGLDVTYLTDVNVQQDPALLLAHRAIFSLGHDECWSYTERLAAQTAQQHGVNIAFLAASAVLRHVRLQASPLGPDREEVDYRNPAEDPLDGHGNPLRVTGNTWSSPPANYSEVPFVGEAYSGFLEPNAPPAPLVVADASAWIYRGTGLHNGSVVPGVLASDFDQFDVRLHPANLQILAHSPVPRADSQSSISPPYSDMSYYTDPTSGAGVFDSGTNAWIPDLDACARAKACPAPVIAELTGNLFALFGRGPAGRSQPSVPNWSQFYR